MWPKEPYSTGRTVTNPAAARANIPNPYIASISLTPNKSPVLAPRPNLVRVVKNALVSKCDKPTLALYGPHRMGKSTFFHQLPRLLPDEVIPVLVDLQEPVEFPGPGGYYYNWAEAACKSAYHQRGLILKEPQQADFYLEPAIALSEWLDTAEHALGERKLFFAFDNFLELVAAAKKNPALKGMFDILRHISQYRRRVYLLFTGIHQLEELAPDGGWHDYFISVRGIQVSYLDSAHARRLLTDPIPNFPLKYAEGALDEIIRLTRCQPYLVQLMAALQEFAW